MKAFSRRELAIGVVMMASVTATVAAHAEVPWRKSFAVARAEAAKTKRLMFVEFTVPGCQPCARLEATSYPAVAPLMAELIPVKVDITVDTALADHYGVQSSPDLFLMTAAGEVVNRITRYVEPADLGEFLQAGLLAPEHISGRPSVPWAKSYGDAQALSKSTGKPIFVYVWNYG